MSLSVSLHMLARAPRPGQVKTRLIPALGADGACDLQRRLVERALSLCADGFSQRFLWLDDGPDTKLQALAEQHGWTVVEQPAGDLGERMRCITALGLVESDAVMLIGNDCPAINAEYLAQARAALVDAPAVLGPAEDGGYVLLGLRQNSSRLFSNIAWGTAEVLRLTLARLAELDWRYKLLPVLWDVDRPEDLQRLASLGIEVG
ncbi:TIGR04282 family arsenosugar biosynthesis glycosyltransferase [Pseudomonas sp. NPDC078700]|uniref:TIGR04282 family arsenosugar biosynthesis glycosyltransferase n=1 Tax=Pseudomonas sp. NPDC078700 TaxID=3364424 RepID=UPI0037C782AA